jgi:intracellular septation protein
MKLLFDFFPILLFFITYKWAGIYSATLMAIAVSLIQVIWGRLREGRFEKMPVITFITLLVTKPSLSGNPLLYIGAWVLGFCYLIGLVKSLPFNVLQNIVFN